MILEPLVTVAFAALALLGLLTTLFFYLVGPPDFPRWTMLALSLGFALALVPYHALIQLLSTGSKDAAALMSAHYRLQLRKNFPALGDSQGSGPR